MMILSPRRGLLALLFAVLAVVGAVLLASCSGDDDDDQGNGGTSATQGVLQAILFLDGAGLHGIDDAINEDGEIPADAVTVARKAEAVTRLTDWPSDLERSADALARIFADMAATLDSETPDMDAAGQVATQAHDAQHDFSHDVWQHLYAEAGVEAGGGDH